MKIAAKVFPVSWSASSSVGLLLVAFPWMPMFFVLILMWGSLVGRSVRTHAEKYGQVACWDMSLPFEVRGDMAPTQLQGCALPMGVRCACVWVQGSVVVVRARQIFGFAVNFLFSNGKKYSKKKFSVVVALKDIRFFRSFFPFFLLSSYLSNSHNHNKCFFLRLAFGCTLFRCSF
jgi:hypothetical protein